MLLLYKPLCVARHQDLFPLVPAGAEGLIVGNSLPYPGQGVSGCVHEGCIVFHAVAIAGRHLFFKIGGM